MHFPINIPIGKSHIPVHFICETLAYFLGYRYYAWLRKHHTDSISEHNRLIIFIGAAFGAFVGSHVVGVLENPTLLSQFNIMYFMGNKTIVGGMLGGLIGVELTKKQIGVTVSSGDMMVYPLVVAMVIGRTGCFLAGLEDGTYGIASNLPWAIDFGDGIRRHPTNLYEILFWLILWMVLQLVEKRYEFTNGSRFKVFMVSYLLFRFLDEFIKPDYFFSFGLSVIQLVCIAGILYYYKVFLYPQKLIKPHARTPVYLL
ncbi:Prolipoprotein diacylglyceryltransferase [Mucilaginibacter pineti]|uniref:Prolipoprotein diacylglyceryltransferase n=1 Tax=Mucilaginibacter pineti TaxID=1391627 RepID=A0A1G6YRJ4_9SPHI|nr:prolipoprotein diacylglyceryl transferase family protein [Mucilaginibacter pineti]SDD92287.1 Prolipoprotein diacylglyceryltransferase [Mucilaginibacter pineti]